jgi:hypothetical protein
VCVGTKWICFVRDTTCGGDQDSLSKRRGRLPSGCDHSQFLVRPSESILSLAGLFLKSCYRCRRRAPKGAGEALNCIWAISVARTGYSGSIAPNLLQLRLRSSVAIRSTALDRRPFGGKLPVPPGYTEHLHYFYHFTRRSQSGGGFRHKSPGPSCRRLGECVRWSGVID